jgi:hypothetical protein
MAPVVITRTTNCRPLFGMHWQWTLLACFINFIVKKNLEVNVTSVTCKFYAALNSVLCKCKSAAEPVKLQLVNSFFVCHYYLILLVLWNLKVRHWPRSRCAGMMLSEIYFYFTRFESVK